jgi:hypothetical protein
MTIDSKLDCISIEVPDDYRFRLIQEILDTNNSSYARTYLKSIVHPHKIKFILFDEHREWVLAMVEEVLKSRYDTDDFVHQVSFKLDDNSRRCIVNLFLK